MHKLFVALQFYKLSMLFTETLFIVLFFYIQLAYNIFLIESSILSLMKNTKKAYQLG